MFCAKYMLSVNQIPVNLWWYNIIIPAISWIGSPPKRYVGVRTPNTSEHKIIWRYDLYRLNQVKINSLGWTPIQYDQWTYKKGKSDTKIDIHKREKMWIDIEKTAIYKSK